MKRTDAASGKSGRSRVREQTFEIVRGPDETSTATASEKAACCQNEINQWIGAEPFAGAASAIVSRWCVRRVGVEGRIREHEFGRSAAGASEIANVVDNERGAFGESVRAHVV